MKRQEKRPDNGQAQPAAALSAGNNNGVAGFLRWLRRHDGVLGVLLVAATLAAYQPAWHGGLIWDDDQHVTPPGLRSLHGLGRIWTQLGATQQYYPLVHTVFWVEHRLWGDGTWGCHWVNMLLHAFSALLLVRVLRRLNVPGAWLAGFLFALHPVEVESVAWISELKNTMSGVFYLGAALAYLGFDRGRGRWNYGLALGLFALGLMCKTVIASLPGALLVVFWRERGKLSWKRDALPLVPFFMAGAGAGLLTAWVERRFIGAEGAEFELSVMERILIAGRAAWFYLGKLAWPSRLSFVYPRWEVSGGEWWQYLFPAGVLALAGVLAWRRWRGPLAGLLFFLGTLFPALGFLNVYPFRYSFVADHFQYLASLGPLTVAAAGISGALGLYRERKPYVEAVLCAGLLGVLGTLTWRQCGMYADAETLWKTTLRLNPDSWLAHTDLGAIFLKRGKLDDAMLHYKFALQINPRYQEAYNGLGAVLLQKGQVDEAIAQFQKALQVNPDDAEAQFNLGAALAQKGRLDDAIAQYQKALQTNPGDARGHLNLALTLLEKGRTSEVAPHFQKALELGPEKPQILNSVAWTLATCSEASLRNGGKAVQLAQRANDLDGGRNPATLRTLAAAFAEAGRFGDAMSTAQKAMELARTAGQQDLAAWLDIELNRYKQGLPLHP